MSNPFSLALTLYSSSADYTYPPPKKKSGLEKDGNRWIGLVPTLIRSYGQTCTCSSKPGESSMTVTGMYANNVQLPSCADVVSVP